MDNWKEKFLPISWSYYTQAAFNLSKQLNDCKVDIIVAIARGGLTLSQLLSDALDLPIASFTVKSYKDFKQESVPQITHGLGTTLENKKVLLVDDVCDSGKTFIRGIDYLIEQGAEKKNITTASLHYKPHAIFKPDYFVAETSAWVIYPSETRETIEQLCTMWKKEGIKKDAIIVRLKQLHFKSKAIDSYLI